MTKRRNGLLWVLGALLLGTLPVGRSGAAPQEPAVPPLTVEDFESATLGARPFLWKEDRAGEKDAVIGVERMALDGNDVNKALKFDYDFTRSAASRTGLGAGPGEQPLPGGIAGLSAMVYGDASGNAMGLRLRDRGGKLYTWWTPVTWTGWKKVRISLDPAAADHNGAGGKGAPEMPLALDTVRIERRPGAAAKGAIFVDEITAECEFGAVSTLYDTSDGVKLDGWKAIRNRATAGEVGETTAPRAGREIPVLKLAWEYENGADSSVEWVNPLPAGAGHGTLVMEIFGDGSNNLLRFRMQDGADRIWSANLPTLLIDWSGWKTVYINTRTLRGPEGGAAVMTRFPVKFYSLAVDDVSPSDHLPGVESGRKGELYVGRILYCREK